MKNSSVSILMVIERFFPLVGGAERQCQQLSSEFVKKGVKVAVVTKRWQRDWEKKELMDGFRIFRLGIPGENRFSDYFAGFSLIFFIIRNFRKFDNFFINGGLANIFGSTAIFWGKIFGKKVIAKVETPGELIFSGPQALSAKKYVHPLVKMRLAIVKMSDYFISQTPQVKEELLAFGISEERIKNITNSVDENIFAPSLPSEKIRTRNALKLPVDKIMVTFCGRLVKRKGLLSLLVAWERLEKKEKAILVIVGSGKNQPDSIEDELKKFVADKNLRNVFFLGSKSVIQVAEILKTSDIFVYPSIHPEGTALSVLEAMACGLPVVVSNVGGLVDVVTNEIDGLIVSKEDVAALSSTLESLIKESQKRKLLGKKGREKVLEKYSTQKITEEYIRFLSEIN